MIKSVVLGSLTLLSACTTGTVRRDAGPEQDSDAGTDSCATCTVCSPNRGMCDGDSAYVCRADGSGYDLVDECDPARLEHCDPSGRCVSACEEAAATQSYIGCEYWPVITMNSQLGLQFHFAVVVANDHDIPATVVVTRGDTELAQREVAPGSIEAIELPWVPELKQRFRTEESAVVHDGAYRLVSSLPVTVHQYNPLEFQIDGAYSYSNDASLLLPAHVLTSSYLVVTQPSLQFIEGGIDFRTSPGFVAITAVEEGTTQVEVTFSAHVIASTDGLVRAFGPGDVGYFPLVQGDVIQFASAVPSECNETARDDGGTYCMPGPDYDFTGTQIRASGHVSVIAGHNCAFVPNDRWACDHLEESVFPEEAWGRDAIVGRTIQLNGEPNIVRIVSAHDGNAIEFDPPSVHEPVTLARGVPLELKTTQSVRVRGSEAFLAAEFLVARDYIGFTFFHFPQPGDPSMSYTIPTEQFRTEYTFLSPPTYDRNLVNVIAPVDAEVMLDGLPVFGFGTFETVGESGYRVANVDVGGGQHSITGTMPFGATLYGFGDFTSYMLPAGLDFRAINVPF